MTVLVLISLEHAGPVTTAHAALANKDRMLSLKNAKTVESHFAARVTSFKSATSVMNAFVQSVNLPHVMCVPRCAVKDAASATLCFACNATSQSAWTARNKRMRSAALVVKFPVAAAVPEGGVNFAGHAVLSAWTAPKARAAVTRSVNGAVKPSLHAAKERSLSARHV